MLDFSQLEPKIVEASKLMEMLSKPARLRILCTLLEGEQSVLNLASIVDMSQPALSHHLKKLRDVELVATRRDGQTIYYSLNGNEVKQVLEVLHRLYCS